MTIEEKFAIVKPQLEKYFMREFFDDNVKLNSDNTIGLAYTTYGNDEQYDIQVDLDLDYADGFPAIVYYLNGKMVDNYIMEEEHLHTLEHDFLDFCDLIRPCVMLIPDEDL